MKQGSPTGLYEEDFVRWTEQQSSVLHEAARSGVNLQLDWENLAGEIEGLGRSERRELRSRISVIIEHLLKLEHSPARNPRRAWMDTIARERSNIELLIEDSPSLRGEAARMIADETKRAVRNASRALIRRGEGSLEAIDKRSTTAYTEAQVLGDWYPGDPSPGPSP
jgi:hypothetical protein